MTPDQIVTKAETGNNACELSLQLYKIVLLVHWLTSSIFLILTSSY